jgi:hypothetical protein
MQRMALLPQSLPLARALLLATVAGCASAGAQTTMPAPAPLPDAPSTTVQTGGAIVNGVLYRKPTRREDFLAYRHELIGPRPFVSAAIRSGIEQARSLRRVRH